MSTLSSNLAEAKRSAEALIKDLDDSEFQRTPLESKKTNKTRSESPQTSCATADYNGKCKLSPDCVKSEIEVDSFEKCFELPKTTNIKSQYVVINNYNNYTYQVPLTYSNATINGYDFIAPYMTYCYPYNSPYSFLKKGPPVPFNSFNYMKSEKKEMEIEELLNNIDVAVRDQASCRLLQRKLSERDRNFAARIFHYLIPSIKSYMNDPFGNYLCQKLFEQCDINQLNQIIDQIASDVVSIAKNLHGTRALQKFIEKSVNNSDLLLKIIRALRSHVADMVMDNNGNHVLQLCLTIIKNPYNDFIYNEITESCLKIATHKHGCCVLQKCIDYSNSSQRVHLKLRLEKLN